MKLVDRQVLRELAGPFMFGVAAFSSVAFTLSVLPKVTEWLMNGMPFATALEIVLYSLPSILFFTLPMSTLLAVLMGVGLTPDLFRFGASSLLGDIERQLEHHLGRRRLHHELPHGRQERPRPPGRPGL